MVGLGRSTADRCRPGRSGASRDLPVGCRRDRGGNRTQRPHGFGADIATEIAALTGRPFVNAPNRFEAQGGLDGITLDRAKITEYLDRAKITEYLDRAKITEYLYRSLMLVTALSPAIGYDKASRACIGITKPRAMPVTTSAAVAPFDTVIASSSGDAPPGS